MTAIGIDRICPVVFRRSGVCRLVLASIMCLSVKGEDFQFIRVQRESDPLTDANWKLLWSTTPWDMYIVEASPVISFSAPSRSEPIPGNGGILAYRFSDHASRSFFRVKIVKGSMPSFKESPDALVTRGTFKAGCATCEPAIIERTVVLTKDYAMGRTEVTCDQFAELFNWGLSHGFIDEAFGRLRVFSQDLFNDRKAFRTADGYPVISLNESDRIAVLDGHGELPVTGVTWYGAMMYCYLLNLRDGLPQAIDVWEWTQDLDRAGYRLPTEAEWEYACRTEADASYHAAYDETGLEQIGEHNLDLVGWYSENSDLVIRDVGGKAPNKLGIYDLHGNVNEWCFDAFLETTNSDLATDPIAQGSDDPYTIYRAARGGSAASPDWGVSASNRSMRTAELGDRWTGFRVVRSLIASD